MKKWLFNPFVYIAGFKSLLLGWLILLVTAIVAYFGNAHLNGVLDLHYGIAKMPLWVYLLESFGDWGISSVVLLLIGFFVSKTNFRYVDVFGTMALARWPMIVPVIFGLFIKVPASIQSDPLNAITPSMVLVGLLGIPFSVWMVALMYNAFRISCNLRGAKAVISFIAGLIISEAIAWLAFYSIHKHLA